ncbi:hypothetical protein EJ06DRAFT_529975 [Trichodelitschia bisporula]|uniref:Uncharacterized protein n=1 Tax=Trichodelitschia bisporula TaxID=703511 RepID=A0A6G1HXZ3_9PEZI|nr:hypothetical protein EJ06DRAFT_529975 [Trichodelitschia bisporula]
MSPQSQQSGASTAERMLAFPPPPGPRDRSQSKPRFTLSALTRAASKDRSQPPPAAPGIDALTSSTAEALSRAPPSRWDQPSLAGPSRPPPPTTRSSVYIPTAPAPEPPPAARRSASTGAIAPRTTPTWEPGMPLPPPPPGAPGASRPSRTSRTGSGSGGAWPGPHPPPPPRAASSTRADGPSNQVPIIALPTRRPPGRGTALGPVPPTPAGWVEGQGFGRDSPPPPLPPMPTAAVSGNGGGPGPSSLVRRTSTTPIRERRNASRARDGEAGPSDLTLSPGHIRQGAFKKPRSPTGPVPQATPPFSPSAIAAGKTRVVSAPSMHLGRGLVTPPLMGERPVSHILHLPNEELGLVGASPALVPERRSSEPAVGEGDAFVAAAAERHRLFLAQEAAAPSDAARLALFAAFMVAESRVRRERYSAAFTAMGSDVLELTRDLWRAPSPLTTETFASPDSYDAYSSTSSAFPSPGFDMDAAGPHRQRHQPVLSPIPSMAQSSIADGNGDDSRGRPASRWWESSASSGGRPGGRRIERSKRESRFMGLPAEALSSLQWEDEGSPGVGGTPTQLPGGGPSGEYPPEKVGWHDIESALGSARTVPATPTPEPGLDVSRLVTLPPPYPRHHPAVANNHPDLAGARDVLLLLKDTSEVGRVKDAYVARIAARRERFATEAAERAAAMRRGIQEQVAMGLVDYTGAAAAEAAFHAEEEGLAGAERRAEFDGFGAKVLGPLMEVLGERVAVAGACIEGLEHGMEHGAGADAAQREGDEQPELLERLNLLKWVFEAREVLHRAMFTLEAERDDKYRELVTAPLRKPGLEARLAEAEGFFESDKKERLAVFEAEVKKRYDAFAAQVEAHVTRGVEAQLCAFWDIAPGLRATALTVPGDEAELAVLDVRIPGGEIVENPGYAAHPLQYLFVLLGHAQKAAYQFIESQINLMCLLHEARTGAMRASGGGRDEEERLTAELKERVGTVEGLWREALGEVLEGVREKVERVLVAQGGWDEALLE